MAYKVIGFHGPKRFFVERKSSTLKPAGLFLPIYESQYASTSLIPIIDGDRIIDMMTVITRTAYAFNKYQILNGASFAMLGDPAQYVFIDPLAQTPFTAIREVLVPHIRNAIKKHGKKWDEDLYEMADTFCEGKLPSELAQTITDLAMADARFGRNFN